MSETLFTGISQLATPRPGPRRGAEMGQLDITEQAALLVRDGLVAWVGPAAQAPDAANEVNLGGRAVVPGLVDPHTHAVWAGHRLADWEAKLQGATYEDILARGGGIRSTMRATAAATLEALEQLTRPRLQRLTASGATTVEVKSGYGLDFAAELRMLEVVRRLQGVYELQPTLLIHVPPEENRARYVQGVCEELIPEVAHQGLATSVDVFTEKEAFNVQETRAIFEAARANGLHIKLHADQFHAIGGTELACEMGALSVDHLEASGEAQIRALAESDTVATVLPGVTLHLGLPAAPARALVDAGAIVAVGTDLNPGSSPLFSTQLALALSVRLNKLTPAEALSACTVNAAHALGLSDRGSLSPGQRADFCVLAGPDWREVAYALGGQAVQEVHCAHSAQAAFGPSSSPPGT
ncbi:imidazolonepropionase [Deinococcus piscis]|uniref:Imidazolonepropionase n=1 Tax=Deinococcus piscis TaxID=394230 RepID=A0ABQ3K047_9DEIO|nr:imidazolonepropionase [Deinococcus piscis]GHF94462.1 imidazolonepropionase [Deinococcus piscis]